MKRAAVSIPANIAEGFKRRGRADKARFMNIAAASLEEIRYYLILAPDLNYGNTDALMHMLEEVSKLLNAYSNAILNSEFCLLLKGLSVILLKRLRQFQCQAGDGLKLHFIQNRADPAVPSTSKPLLSIC
jgi:hypothetical protein